jgi:hypothetical protein
MVSLMNLAMPLALVLLLLLLLVLLLLMLLLLLLLLLLMLMLLLVEVVAGETSYLPCRKLPPSPCLLSPALLTSTRVFLKRQCRKIVQFQSFYVAKEKTCTVTILFKMVLF